MQKWMLETVKNKFFNECIERERIISLMLEPIDHHEINCFYSNDLWKFLDIHDHWKKTKASELLKNLIKLKKNEEKINLTRLNSIACSKSKSAGYRFQSIYLFGKNVFLDRNEKWSFDGCIKHIMDRHNEINLYHYLWNDRYSWSNSDGSHHCAVAIFLAENNSITYELQANISIKYIDLDIANELLDLYDIFVINQSNKYELQNCFEEEILMYDISNTTNTLVLFEKPHIRLHDQVRLLQKFDSSKILFFNDYLLERIETQKGLTKQ